MEIQDNNLKKDFEKIKREALEKLKNIPDQLPSASTLIDIKVNNVFAEPGT